MDDARNLQKASARARVYGRSRRGCQDRNHRPPTKRGACALKLLSRSAQTMFTCLLMLHSCDLTQLNASSNGQLVVSSLTTAFACATRPPHPNLIPPAFHSPHGRSFSPSALSYVSNARAATMIAPGRINLDEGLA